MKIALYIEDGLEQVVLTPESDTEKGILGKMHDGSRDLSVLRGAFYECRGGWVREGLNNDSTMVVLRPAKPRPAPLDLPGLAALARRTVENTTPRFLGNDNRALEIAQHFQNDIANAVYAEVLSAGVPPAEETWKMKIILNPNDGASSLDLMELARSAHFAIDHGIADQPKGYVMCVTIGPDPRNTYGVVRRKGCVSVYPPSPTPET